jgi:hypothetical protein
MLLSIFALCLTWSSVTSFYVAVMLAALSPLGFLGASCGRRYYSGTFSDPNGIPPARLRLLGRLRRIDLNLVAVVAALLALIAAISIYRM